MLAQLPQHSRYVEALTDDPEWGEWASSLPESSAPRNPRLSDWTPDVATLTEIKDRLTELIAVTLQAAGGKAPQVHPSLRPLTAADKLRAAKRMERHNSLVQEVQEAQARWAAQREV